MGLRQWFSLKAIKFYKGVCCSAVTAAVPTSTLLLIQSPRSCRWLLSMVLFGGYHTAKRFFDDDRLTAHFPGPGSYAPESTFTSAVDGATAVATKYAIPLVEDGVVRPDGSVIGFRERDSWVRGKEGPKVEMTQRLKDIVVSVSTFSSAGSWQALATCHVVNRTDDVSLSA